jgi:cytochrome b subunit of formate dehydrogenase
VASEAAQSPGTRVAGTGVRGLTGFEHVVHTVAIVGFAIQALTGLYAKYIAGEFTGWPLYIHMLGAPLFIIGLVLVAIVWADRCRFAGGDTGPAGGLTFGQKLMFWIGIPLGLVVIGSMLAAMLPVFGYAGQGLLQGIHEISALLLVVVMVVHTVVSLAARRAKR